ncbi:MAG TPA: deoxyribonuclease IV, partial [Spirochaetia bacterium]|nr:deoxyribonuclease IV [Spirochaetia bacterium]
MRFGFHVSIQGGLSRAPERARELGCECFQIFSQSPRSWGGGPPPQDEVRRFRKATLALGLWPVVIHTPYLLNLAAEDVAILERSRVLLAAELERAALIGADYVVVHMGTRKKNSETRALELMAESIDQASAAVSARGGGPGPAKTALLLENTSGGGGKLGYAFEHLAAVRTRTRRPEAVGVCLDTAHLFQAGHPIHKARGLNETLNQFDRLVGLSHLHLLHLNDSLT